MLSDLSKFYMINTLSKLIWIEKIDKFFVTILKIDKEICRLSTYLFSNTAH